MFQKLKKLIYIICFSLSMTSLNAFVISGNDSCRGSKVYGFDFDENAILPMVSIQVSENTIIPDITMKIVDNPREADLIFVDNFDDAKMKICRVNNILSDEKIKVGRNIILPDIKIKLSKNPIFPDYKIYISSQIFTNSEVAAIFALLWKKK